MNKKRTVISKKKIMRFLLILIIIIVIIFGLIKLLNKKTDKPSVGEVIIVDDIGSYGYVLSDNKTEYYKNLFNQLKIELHKDEIDEEVYATLISKLFISDLLDLNSKISSSDIGGTQFIYTNYKTDFENIAKSTLYNYVESNIYNDRKQKLPIVSNVEVKDIANDEFEYNEEVDKNAYYINVSIEYKEDLGYDKNYEIVIIHSNDKLEIAKLNSIDSN